MEPISARSKGSDSEILLQWEWGLVPLPLFWAQGFTPSKSSQPVLYRLTEKRRILCATITINAETGREPYKKEKLLKVIQGICTKLGLTSLERAHDLDQLPFTKDNLLRKLFLLFPWTWFFKLLSRSLPLGKWKCYRLCNKMRSSASLWHRSYREKPVQINIEAHISAACALVCTSGCAISLGTWPKKAWSSLSAQYLGKVKSNIHALAQATLTNPKPFPGTWTGVNCSTCPTSASQWAHNKLICNITQY